jgi:16S rRNA (guanine527-N7)-methyltransferase
VKDLRRLVRQGLSYADADIDDYKIEQFCIYLQVLQDWNKKFNLTRIVKAEEIVYKHFLDSLTCALVTDLSKRQDIIDIGTGAGFPGLPIKICFPEIHLTLLESSSKKVEFLEEVTGLLRLSGVRIVCGRAEEVGRRQSFREMFDVALARAITQLRVLVEFALPFVRLGGIFLAMKAKGLDEELREAKEAIKVLGGEVKEARRLLLPSGGERRSILVLQKIAPTPDRFPRRTGIPEKRPI